MKEWLSRLDDLRRLENNWNNRGAPAPSEEALPAAALFLQVMRSKCQFPSRIAASAVGGVGITLRRGDRIAYVEFYNTGTACALLCDEVSEGETFRVAVNAHSFVEAIGRMEAFLHACPA
jgi:hypothetical protein